MGARLRVGMGVRIRRGVGSLFLAWNVAKSFAGVVVVGSRRSMIRVRGVGSVMGSIWVMLMGIVRCRRFLSIGAVTGRLGRGSGIGGGVCAGE
jgi:hypothetical protein